MSIALAAVQELPFDFTGDSKMSNISKTLALAFAGACIAGSAFADTVSPSTYSATLGVGESTTITKTITVAQKLTTGLVDIFFLADSTGSMSSAINSVKSAASSLLASTAGYGNVRWGVGDYKDFGDPYVYNTGTPFTNVQASVQAGINAWSAGYGGDYQEADLFALTQVASLPWRVGATHILVWFGDASGHDPSGGATLASTTAALKASNIVVEAIDNGSLNDSGQATALATATGGNYFKSFGSGVGTAIGTAITTAIDTYTKVCLDASGAPAGVGVTVGDCITGTFDRSEERTFEIPVTFTGKTPGDYSFGIGASVDGGLVATEADRITVKDGGTVPEPGTLLLLGAALAAVGSTRRTKRD